MYIYDFTPQVSRINTTKLLEYGTDRYCIEMKMYITLASTYM